VIATRRPYQDIIMPLSMHEISVPVFVRQLTALSALLAKGEAFAQEKGMAPATLIDARLAPDMLPLARQIQIASDAAKGACARLGDVETPGFPDTETSFAELQDRIARTIAFVQSVPAERFDGSESRTVAMKTRETTLEFTGQVFLLHVALPNFFFHVSTAYAILRNNGVPLGKLDYLGGL
jgi:hypothetical protein